jgi:cardiolipin synthase A/B
MALLEKLRRFRDRRAAPKRAPRPAPPRQEKKWTGWFIALCACLGFGAYFWMTSARLLKEPIRIDYGPLDPPFASALGPTLGAELTDGNRVQVLENGDAFFPAMLKAIAGAKQTITFETYIWESGYISNKFIDALGERARAGVKVHVIVDGMGSLKFKRSDRDRLRDTGVELYVYGREHWYQIKPNINHRTHRKLLIVDGRTGFTGGMCVGDAWLGNANTKHVWRETQVRVEGPAVRQMQAVFATNWMQTTSALLLGEEYFPKIAVDGDALAHCFKSGPAEAPQAARLGYLFAIAAARKSIDIAQAYFVPDDLAIEMLLEARARGVRIRVIVPAINDSRFGRAASRSRWGKLLAAGVEFHRYLPAMYHCKTMSVDDVFVVIGSANFDNRSFSINDEVTLDVLDRGFAADHRKMFERDLKVSTPLTLEEFETRKWYVKVADHVCGLFRSQF